MPSLRVIVVNYNAGEALIPCIESVLAYGGPLDVVVADNGSTDQSMKLLAAHAGDEPRLTLKYNDHNLGFGPAVNREALGADEDYILVLNPDCVLAPEALQRLVEALEQDPAAAVAGPWITDTDGEVQSGTWRRLPNPWQSLMSLSGLSRFSRRVAAFSGVNEPGKTPPDRVIRAEAVSGACMLVRRLPAAAIGFFDEAYRMHCEDLDLMHRLRQGGHHCLLVPSARAVHSGGLSSASRPWWVHRQKHHGMQRYFDKFLASEHSWAGRMFITAGIWIHWVATLPVVLFHRIFRSR